MEPIIQSKFLKLMPYIPPLNPEQSVFKALGDVIHTEIEKHIESEIETAKTKLTAAIRGSVGAITAKVLNNFSFERVGRDLVITVKFAFEEPKQP